MTTATRRHGFVFIFANLNLPPTCQKSFSTFHSEYYFTDEPRSKRQHRQPLRYAHMDLQRGDDLGHGDQMSWRKNHFMF
jgi:hypothetical protein